MTSNEKPGQTHSRRGHEGRVGAHRHRRRALATLAVILFIAGLAVPAGLLLLAKTSVWSAIIGGSGFEVTALALGVYSWKYNRAKVVVLLVLVLCLYAIVIGRQSSRQDAGGGGTAPSSTDGEDPRF